MQTNSGPILRDLVLVGGGHSHVAVLKAFGMQPLAGLRITLVCTDAHTPYSGMLPGYVAGHYSYDEVHLDLVRLCVYAGARFVRAQLTGIDREARQVLLHGRPPLDYDLLAINTGSTPQLAQVQGAAEHAIAVKPIAAFNARWLQLLANVRAGQGPRRIAVVGAGAGGVELLLAMQYRLGNECKALGLPAPQFSLFSAAPEILPTHSAGVRARFMHTLHARGVQVHGGARVQAVSATGVQLLRAAATAQQGTGLKLGASSSLAPVWRSMPTAVCVSMPFFKARVTRAFLPAAMWPPSARALWKKPVYLRCAWACPWRAICAMPCADCPSSPTGPKNIGWR